MDFAAFAFNQPNFSSYVFLAINNILKNEYKILLVC